MAGAELAPERGERGAVWVVAGEQRGALTSTALELVAEGRRLARKYPAALEVVLFGAGEGAVEALADRGVAAVHLVRGVSLDAGDLAPAAALLTRLARDNKPALVLLGTTRAESELAGRLAARLGSGLAANCSRLELDDAGRLQAERAVYGGRATATVLCRGPLPLLATLTPEAGAAGAVVDRQMPAVRPVQGNGATPSRLEVEGFWKPDPWEMDLAEAEVIVAGGRGLCAPDDFRMLAELATLLGGAVAASRPVVDAGVAPYNRQVGLSGRTVSPRLYVACGISGATHHLIGMRGAEAVVAINSDPHAPIFDRADVGIVGDAREVVPALIARLRERKGAGAAAARAEVAHAGGLFGGDRA